ncbi:glycosyltransferase family 39 protein [bacterium]|nr:glycosyltransferase family 39 protein [bacterium]
MTKPRRRFFWLLFLLGASIRSINIWQGLDGNIRESWREADIASIARNYYQEGMDLCYPRIDWRGDGPGYAEMEFPALPYLMALFYRLWGIHETIGKILSFCFSLAAFYFFILLSHHLLPERGALAASIFFALNPLTGRTANTLQPESFMLLFYIMAVYFFIKWRKESTFSSYSLAILSTGSVILAKASAIHIGLFFLFILSLEKGRSFIREKENWIYGLLSLIPGIAWYHHAHCLWLRFGNSLGISNESHWVGWDFFVNPYFIKGILRNEIFYVWMPSGLIVVLLGLVLSKLNRVNKLCLLWLAAISIYYFIAARTTADGWAFYYHLVSVPPAALLFGNAVDAFLQHRQKVRLKALLVMCGFWMAFTIGLGFAHALEQGGSFCTLLLIYLPGLIALLFFKPSECRSEERGNRSETWWLKPLLPIVLFLIVTTFATMSVYLAKSIHSSEYDRLQTLYTFAKESEKKIPPNSLIICSGGPCTDRDGYPVAYNASYMFYWLNRKGFSICAEEQNVDAVQALMERGACFYLVERSSVVQRPTLKNELEEHYQLLDECSEAYLFSLQPVVRTFSQTIRATDEFILP